MRRSFLSPSARSSPTTPARRRTPTSAPNNQRRETPAAVAMRHRPWPGTRWVRGGTVVTAYVLLGLALARLAVAIDSQPALVREALQVGLSALAVGDLSTQPPVLPAGSGRLQDQPTLAQPEPVAEPEQQGGQGVGSGSAAKRLILWEYDLVSWGEVAFTPTGIPVAGSAAQFRETVAAAIEEFQERYPQVAVDVTWLSEGQVLPELARAAAGATGLPDLVALPEATIAHPRASSLANLTLQGERHSPAARQGQRLEPGAARSFAAGEGPWVIPRWLEWQAWVGSKGLWHKLGLDIDRVVRSGWHWTDVTQAVRKSLGGGSTAGSQGHSRVYLFPTPWTFAGILLASERPTPYVWPTASGGNLWRLPGRTSPAETSVELWWDGEFLHRLAGVWQEWTRDGGPRPYADVTMGGWLAAAGRGDLIVGGPVGPTLIKYLFDGPAGLRAGVGQQPGTGTAPRDSSLLFLPIPTSAAGEGSVLPVRLSGYQVLGNADGAPAGTADRDRLRLAAELGLVLARRVQAWAVRKHGYLPVEMETAPATGNPEALLPAYHPVELVALLQASPRQAVQPLLPPDFEKAKAQAVEELARLAPELTAGRTDPATVAERMREILQAPLLPLGQS